MEITWQDNNVKSRQLKSLIFSVLIVLMILKIPIDFNLNVTQHEKMISIELIKNTIPNNNLDVIQSTSIKETIKTKNTILPELSLVKNISESDVINTQTAVDTDNSPKKEKLPANETILYSDKIQDQSKEASIDTQVNTTEDNTQTIESYNYPLLLNPKQERSTFKDKIKQKLSMTRHPIYMPIAYIETIQDKMIYCPNLERKSLYCFDENLQSD